MTIKIRTASATAAVRGVRRHTRCGVETQAEAAR